MQYDFPNGKYLQAPYKKEKESKISRTICITLYIKWLLNYELTKYMNYLKK